mgnify:CR=1 FL=1
MISKILASLIEFLAGFGKALPQIAENRSKRLEIREPAKKERIKGRMLRISRRNLRKKKRLERAINRQKKREN